mgnify:FL=1|jgi:uncharacterized cupredoxin-like copper-binding protein
MRTLENSGAVVMAAAFALLPMLSNRSAAHDNHASYSAGEPGDPKKPFREIVVEMGDRFYKPKAIEVKRGEQVRFVIRNDGHEDHEFLLDSTEANLKHAEVMKKNPGMEHAEPNGIQLAPNKSGEIVWKFTKAGTFEFSCLIEGHREDGMTGIVVVK